MPTPTAAVRAEGLTKSFGAVRALDGIDLDLPAGTVLGVLGPNGAGKTTTVRVLSTLLRPDAGRAWIAGYDVSAEPVAVRRNLGLSGQYAAVDDNLTGYENLYLVARLYGMSRRVAAARSDALLDRFRLNGARDRVAKGYSGGMRRRLDLAGALVARPPVVVLDEPTTGLDPRSRHEIWDLIGELVTDGTAVLLTTQHLEEADRLAHMIAVIDGGRVIARGTPDELKARLGGERLELVVSQEHEVDVACAVLAGVGVGEPIVDRRTRRLSVAIDTGPRALVEAVQRLGADHAPSDHALSDHALSDHALSDHALSDHALSDHALSDHALSDHALSDHALSDHAVATMTVKVLDIALRRPTLDEVFLTLTSGRRGVRDEVGGRVGIASPDLEPANEYTERPR